MVKLGMPLYLKVDKVRNNRGRKAGNILKAKELIIIYNFYLLMGYQ